MSENQSTRGWTRPQWWPAHWLWHVLPEGEEYDVVLQSVINALMDVHAKPPGWTLDIEPPVLSLDPDFNEIPTDHTTQGDDAEITQVAVVRLAQAAIVACKQAMGKR